MTQTKRCSKCGVATPLAIFSPDPKAPDKMNRWCRTCHKEQMRYRRYKVDDVQLQQMLQEQDHRCGICQRCFEPDDATCVDHDHRCCSGEISCGACVRGIVHRACNRAIGLLGDSEEAFQNAIHYLRRSPVRMMR